MCWNHADVVSIPMNDIARIDRNTGASNWHLKIGNMVERQPGSGCNASTPNGEIHGRQFGSITKGTISYYTSRATKHHSCYQHIAHGRGGCIPIAVNNNYFSRSYLLNTDPLKVVNIRFGSQGVVGVDVLACWNESHGEGPTRKWFELLV
jgi:hypothetical protein